MLLLPSGIEVALFGDVFRGVNFTAQLWNLQAWAQFLRSRDSIALDCKEVYIHPIQRELPCFRAALVAQQRRYIYAEKLY